MGGEKSGMGYGMATQGEYAQNQGKSDLSPDQALGVLKEEVSKLRDQLDSVLSKIKNLEKK
jgi:hypothetical protein